jgi:hypothetical protein
VPLPEGAQSQQAHAEFKNGELRVNIPVTREQGTRRRIPISSSGDQSQQQQQKTAGRLIARNFLTTFGTPGGQTNRIAVPAQTYPCEIQAQGKMLLDAAYPGMDQAAWRRKNAYGHGARRDPDARSRTMSKSASGRVFRRDDSSASATGSTPRRSALCC